VPLDPTIGAGPGQRTDDRPAYRPLVTDFDVVDETTLGATMAGVYAPVVRYQVPDGYQGYAQWFGQDAIGLDDFQNVAWHVTVNDGVRLAYPKIAQVCSLQAYNLTRTHIWLYPGQILALQATNDSASTILVAGRLKGIVWPEDYSR